MNEIKGTSQQINTFIFKKAWAKEICLLPDEQAGQLIKAVFAHTCGLDIKMDAPGLEKLKTLITAEIDIEAYKYLLKKGE